MAFNAQGIFGAAGDLVSGFFSSQGDQAEGNAYGKAAKIDTQNEEIAKQAGQIQQTQEQRQAFQVEGATQAQVGGAGFAASGSSLDIMRSSAQQASLQKQLITAQTQINVNNYAEQAAANKGMEAAANAASSGSLLGGILGAGASLFGL
jgi:hypothetical protein